MKLREIIKKMNNCDQLSGKITILEHGQMVKEQMFDLIKALKGETSRYSWNLPNWVTENKDLFLAHLPGNSDLYLYTVMHDCGKPYSRIKDDCG